MVDRIDAGVTDTEDRILQAARQIFIVKGMQGARMQEIADKAGINKAMLHYYFRTKQLLFEAVFRSAFMEMAPRLSTVINAETPLQKKIEDFCHMYITFIMRQPYLPGFIVNELNRDPGFIQKIQTMHLPDISSFLQQAQDEMDAGRIRRMDPRQLFFNMMSLSIFPFIGAPLLKLFTRTDDATFEMLMSQRSTQVAAFILDAIKAES